MSRVKLITRIGAMAARKANRGNDECSLLLALRKLGGTWKLLLLRELWDRPRRFRDLRSALPRISSTSLARGLKELERDGLISRTVIGTRPPEVTYELLHNDPNLRKAIDHLTLWGRQHNQGTIARTV